MFANHVDFQDRLNAWMEKANGRVHRTVRQVPAERLADEKSHMRSLPARMPDTDRRWVLRVPVQPLVGVTATTTHRLRVCGSGVEVRVSQTDVTAAVLDTGQLAARHRREFAGGLTVIDLSIRRSLSASVLSAAAGARSRSRSARWRAMTACSERERDGIAAI